MAEKHRWGRGKKKYHQQSPDGVVEKDDRGGHEHGEACNFVELEQDTVRLFE